MFLQLRRKPQGLLLTGALLLLSQGFCVVDPHFATPAFAESEASSEASSESGGGGGGRRRGYWRYQMQQNRMAAQQAQKQQQMQKQRQRKQNSAVSAAQRNKPFRVQDYIHEYGSGRSRGHGQRRNFGAGKAIGNLAPPLAAGAQGPAASGGSNLPATSSVPYQKFPPK